MSDQCPCGTGQAYADCCGPIIAGQRPAPTAEALMRSRYTAYAKVAVDHLERSLHPAARSGFERANVEAWAKNAEWLGFKIVNQTGGGPTDEVGSIEFLASYRQDGVTHEHHELANFEKADGEWKFRDGRLLQQPYVRPGPRVGRNDPCPCGSGKKHKKCCAGKTPPPSPPPASESNPSPPAG